jgi:hypothetical protein
MRKEIEPGEQLVAEGADRTPRRSRGPEPDSRAQATPPELDEKKKKGLKDPQRTARVQFKQQITVRVDKRLLGLVAKRVANQGLALTDAVEEGMRLYVEQELAEPLRRLRFLAHVMPLALQQMTLAMIAFLTAPGEDFDLMERETRAMFRYWLPRYFRDERCQRALERLAASKSSAAFSEPMSPPR